MNIMDYEAFKRLSKESQEEYLRRTINDIENEIMQYNEVSEIMNEVFNEYSNQKASFNSPLVPMSEDTCNDMIISVWQNQQAAKKIVKMVDEISNNEKETSVMRLTHTLTGNTGIFLKEYYVTGHGYLTQIKMNDGRIYYAPSHEFIEVLT